MTVGGTGAPIGAPPLPPVSSYVAVGDSFTAGSGVRAADRWADRLAATLRATNSGLAYRNLAFEGATSADVQEQVGIALRLEPDLVTVICGANDVLHSVRPDLEGFAARYAAILATLQDGSPSGLLLTATVPEGWHFLEMGPRTRRRIAAGLAEVNRVIRETARAYRVPYIEVTDDPGLEDSANFCDDGLHPSALGHARVAHAFAHLLRERADDPNPKEAVDERERLAER